MSVESSRPRSITATRLACAALVCLAAVLVAPGRLAAQTISGRVTMRDADVPIADARIVVVGTSLVTVTNADGRYTVRSVEGTQSVRVVRNGFSEQTQSVTVPAGTAAMLDFALARAVINRQEVVTTATGEQRRVEIGSSISLVNAAERTRTALVTDLASLLVAQSPGVQVEPANTIGVGARIRIRGVNSLFLVNDPLYIIDGVRMMSANGSLGSWMSVGGAAQSRASDLNPEEMESVEIVKGPSATTLYGADAANGVIVITTKRGRAGATRYAVFAEGGAIHDYNSYPTAYTLVGKAPGATEQMQCHLTQISAGTCVADSLRSFNLWANPNTTPLHTGYRQNGGLQLSGGSDALRFFTSAQLERTTGVLTIPQFDLQRLDTMRVNVLDEWKNPNYLGRATFRANLNAALSPSVDAAVSAGYITSTNRLPMNDNNARGVGSAGFGGPGYEGSGPGNSGITSLGFRSHGYDSNTPAEIFQETHTQSIGRFIGSANMNWRPTSWLSSRADVGRDNVGREDKSLCLPGNCIGGGPGYMGDDRATLTTTTANFSSTASFIPRPALSSRTTVGAQWVRYALDENALEVEIVPPGSPTSRNMMSSWTTTQTNGLGLFVEEQVALRDKLFLTAAVRADRNSAIGTGRQRVLYPKASLSWVVSEEGFFRKPAWMDQLRIRSAYGTSGVPPDFSGAFENKFPLGNPDLRPERASEFEGGFDAKLFGNRAGFEITYYSKLTHDAFVGVPFPSLSGLPPLTNLGSVKNAGVEVLLQSQIVNRNTFGWDATFTASTNANKLVTLGPVPPIFDRTTREVPGYPLFGWWQRPYTYNDDNHDGIITLNELHVADSTIFLGSSTPRYELSLSNGFDFFTHKLHMNTLFDYKGGYLLLNETERFRCLGMNCRGVSDASAPLAEQARAVAARESPMRTQYGYFEDASFLRFRELSLSYALPQSVTSRLTVGQSASLNFGVRNLHVWTHYSGIDPESNALTGSTDTVPSDVMTMPPPTYFTLRLNVGF